MAANPKLIRMEVRGLMLDPASNMPIVILRNDEGSEFLPIWIGVFEANAIALTLDGAEKPPRPMTHDLLASTLTHLNAEVERIVVNDLENSTFYAQIIVQQGDREVALDSRPSDAIALALRVQAPIFVASLVFEKAQADDMAERLRDEEKLKKWLEEVDPDELGKYTM